MKLPEPVAWYGYDDSICLYYFKWLCNQEPVLELLLYTADQMREARRAALEGALTIARSDPYIAAAIRALIDADNA